MNEYGIDIGSVSLKLAAFREHLLVKTRYIKHHGEPYNLLYQILNGIAHIDRLVLTGASTRRLSEILGAIRINEVEATARGVYFFHPEIRSIIEIGGEDSKLISIDKGRIRDFSSNTICAAGTGMFLDQQARRLCYKIEEFGDVALQSKNPAKIAGRCSVFAKTDMIHLQQIGTSPEDLIAGLCLALARNYKSVIAKGKQIQPPVAFVGGVAANKGMVKAFLDALGIARGDLIIPKYYNCIGAIGAVLSARDLKEKTEFKGLEDLKRWRARPKILERLPPLNHRKKWHTITYSNLPKTKRRAWLGVDVGSISTNLVLIDEDGNVLARRYLWTRGRPIDVVLQGLKEIQTEIGNRVEIVGAGTTGSGRYLIGGFIGADLIKNEISAQARAAIEIDPEVDTIFEIGGQDSKYVSIEDGTIVDFEMNKVCAAGTGSFLEEQAQALAVKLTDFGDLALQAKSPINLGERCTVFIGSEVVHHQKDLNERKNLLAGLGYSIVFNYLNRVVGGKKIGNKIFFQGGVAANKAVASAFEEVLKKEVHIPPNYDITGAIGIALLTREAVIKKTQFKGLDLPKRHYKSRSFTCRHCSNECEINVIEIDNEPPIYYGGRCGRYEKKEKREKKNIPDLFKLRNEIFFATEENKGIEIGIPRSLIFYELFPFFYKFLANLGFKPILSEPTNRKIIELGTEVSVADTCFPVKVTWGHIRSLLQRGIKKFFIPSVITMPRQSKEFTRSFVCPYVQTIPYLARAIFGESIDVFSPYLYFDRGASGITESLIRFGKKFGKREKEVKEAIRIAQAYQNKVQEKLQNLGRDTLKTLNDCAFVVCSRPYNGYDLGLNLDIPKKIRGLGILPIPLDLLPLNYERIKDDFYNMYWHYGQRILSGADFIRNSGNLFAVYLSNFSCGPDSFLTRFFREKLNGKPFLLIETDEHSADAGFITRLEAFYDSIQGAKRNSRQRKILAPTEVKKRRRIYIPNMCDHAKVLGSAMQSVGIDAEVMPEPDENSVRLGRQFTTGKECLPAIITAGDMLKKLKSRNFDPKQSAFFMAQGSGPCRFGQYYKLHRIILDELGFQDIPIYAPNQGPSLFDDLGPLGIKFLVSIWDGICAIDGLEALTWKTRPYESNDGETARVYNKFAERIYDYIKNGKKILPVLREAKQSFDKIAIREEKKPRIGIVGEIYVRSQKFSNNFVIDKLESLGCEVALPSVAEWFFYTNFTRVRNCRWFSQYRRATFTKLFDWWMKWRQHHINKILGLERETESVELLNLSARYMHHSFEGEAILTIGKTVDFIQKRFSGVVNVMPFTCMPGNIVSTIYKSVKETYPDFPLFILAVDGLDHAVDAMRLETFVGQAKNERLTIQKDYI